METTGLSGSTGCFVGRVWAPGEGPLVVTLRGDAVHDITSRTAPTMTDVLERDDPAAFVKGRPGRLLGTLGDLEADSMAAESDPGRRHFLAPNDLQAVKACGVTFAGSMLERVIEERAEGDTSRAQAIRKRIGGTIGDRLGNVRPGSEQAAQVKSALIAEGIWSQYLEVGIGPYAEVFSKAQPMSAVGWGAPVGLHPESNWNNPEPEIVLAVASDGRIKGAALGNDVNLRDFEGRSALLLSKAKDNNASAAIGPFIRLFDESLHAGRRAPRGADAEGRGTRTGSCWPAPRPWPRSAATRKTSWRRPAAPTTSTPTASCSISARCSRRRRTGTCRAKASRTREATWSPSPHLSSGTLGKHGAALARLPAVGLRRPRADALPRRAAAGLTSVAEPAIMSTTNISLSEALKAFVENRDRQRLRGLLLEGAASPQAITADADYFDRLRGRVRKAGRQPPEE